MAAGGGWAKAKQKEFHKLSCHPWGIQKEKQKNFKGFQIKIRPRKLLDGDVIDGVYEKNLPRQPSPHQGPHLLLDLFPDSLLCWSGLLCC